MVVHHQSDQLMLALTAQCTQTSLISFDAILISYDTQDGIVTGIVYTLSEELTL